MFAKKIKCITVIAVALMGAALFCSCDHGGPDIPGTDTHVAPVSVEELIAESGDFCSVMSPSKKLKATIRCKNGVRTISLDGTDGKIFLGESSLGLTIDGKQYYGVSDMTLSEAVITDRTYESNGNQRFIREYCVRAIFSVSHGFSEHYFELRVFDNGIAYRYIIPDSGGTLTLERDDSTFRISDASEAWYGVNSNCGEAIVKRYAVSVNSSDKICTPITVRRRDGGYVSLMQAEANESSGLIYFISTGDSTFGVSNSWESGNENHTVKGGFTSSWKLINVAGNLNELVNNYNVISVCSEPDVELFGTDWVKPGRCAWAWGSTYDTATLEDAQDFTAAAAKLGYEYNLNDYNWRNSWGTNEEITALAEYGKSIGVDQFMIWEAEWIQNTSLINSLVKRLSSCGIAGIKLDLWDRIGNEVKESTVTLQRHLLKRAAENKMLVLLHGCSTGLGWQRTYPNEISREGIYGAEWLGSSTGMVFDFHRDMYAGYLTGELFTRYLSGPADFTPTCTGAMEIASMVCVNSPLLVNMSPVDQILDNPAVEMIKSIPAVWDRTVVLTNSEIGRFAVLAKEKSGVWFLGGIASHRQSGVEVKLGEFLGDGQYYMEMWYDTGSGAMACEKKTVSALDVVRFDEIAPGRGFVCRFSKIILSQNGGAIAPDPVEVETAGNCTIKYTTDGSDPESSASARKYSGGITLTDTCRLRIAITDGDGAGTELAYNFNRIIERISLSGETADIGDHDALKFDDSVSEAAVCVKIDSGARLRAVNIYGYKHGTSDAKLNVAVYRLAENYAATVSSEPLASDILTVRKNDTVYSVDLSDRQISEGKYLITINASDSEAYGGVFLRALRNEPHIIGTFINGEPINRGIEGSIDVDWPDGYVGQNESSMHFVDLFTAYSGNTMGERHTSFNMAKNGDTAATRFAVLEGEQLKKIVVTIPSWFDNKGTITFRVYSWNRDYSTTIESEVLFEQIFDGYRDNSVVTMFMPEGDFGSGEYLILACDAHDNPSSGVGVYLNKKGTDERFIESFVNGTPDGRAMECSLTVAPEK